MNSELLARELQALRNEVAALKRRETSSRPVWTLKSRARGDGLTSARSELSGILSEVPAAGGALEVADGTYILDSDVEIPANVTLSVREGGKLKVASGAKLTINGRLDAGRHPVFEGDGQVLGTPQIEESYPEWFGAAADGLTDDSLAVERAAQLYPRVTGAKGKRYLMTTVRVQHTTEDLYSTGRVQDWSAPELQFPQGIWYGARVPSGAIIQNMKIVLTTEANASGKLQAAFLCGDPNYGKAAYPDAERVQSVKFLNCIFEVAPFAPLTAYKTKLDDPVAAGQTTWKLVSTFDFSNLGNGDDIRLTMDEEFEDSYVFTGEIASCDAGARTVTVVAGPPNAAAAGSTLRGPFVAPVSALIAQSVDDLEFAGNFVGSYDVTLDSDRSVGIYAFNCTGLKINRNFINSINKLATLDYCTTVQCNSNIAWNSGQILDLNKACEDVEFNYNQFNRSAIDTDGDSVCELNGTEGFTAIGNRFYRATRGFIVNNKGLVFKSWIHKMNQDTSGTPEGHAANVTNSYHAVWKNVILRGNHYEWIQKSAIYIGDSWKVFTDERITGDATCGTNITIDDTAINCGLLPVYNRDNGIVTVHEGKQIRIRMHIDNPDAVRTWTAATATAGTRLISIPAPAGKSIDDVIGWPVRIAQDSDASANIYTIDSAVVNGSNWDIITERDIAYASASGSPAWIGPGNVFGISARSWISTDQWGEWLDGSVVTKTATEATERSDLEILELSGHIRTCVDSGFFAYRPRIVKFNGLQIENCGHAGRLRFGLLVVEPEKRNARLRGSLEIDNTANLNQAGSAVHVSEGFHITGNVNLNDAAKWSKTARMLNLYDTRIVGHATRDLEIDDGTNTSFTYAYVDGFSCTIPNQRMTQGMVIEFSKTHDFAGGGGAAISNNNVSITSVTGVTGARKGDLVRVSYTAQKGSWQLEGSVSNDNVVQVIATNRTGGGDTMTGGVIVGQVQKMQ